MEYQKSLDFIWMVIVPAVLVLMVCLPLLKIAPDFKILIKKMGEGRRWIPFAD